MRTIDVIIAILLVIGGLNWGLWGLFQFDLVAPLLGGKSAILSRIVYTLVGVAAAYQAFGWKSIQRRWASVRA